MGSGPVYALRASPRQACLLTFAFPNPGFDLLCDSVAPCETAFGAFAAFAQVLPIDELLFPSAFSAFSAVKFRLLRHQAEAIPNPEVDFLCGPL